VRESLFCRTLQAELLASSATHLINRPAPRSSEFLVHRSYCTTLAMSVPLLASGQCRSRIAVSSGENHFQLTAKLIACVTLKDKHWSPIKLPC